MTSTRASAMTYLFLALVGCASRGQPADASQPPATPPVVVQIPSDAGSTRGSDIPASSADAGVDGGAAMHDAGVAMRDGGVPTHDAGAARAEDDGGGEAAYGSEWIGLTRAEVSARRGAPTRASGNEWVYALGPAGCSDFSYSEVLVFKGKVVARVRVEKKRRFGDCAPGPWLRHGAR